MHIAARLIVCLCLIVGVSVAAAWAWDRSDTSVQAPPVPQQGH
jgi:hypothetical protein